MFSTRQYKEIIGVLLLLIAVILLFSLASFNLNDIRLIADSKPVNNLIGVVGVYLSIFLRSAFGYVSFISFLIFAFAGISVFRKGITPEVIEQIFSMLFLMLTGSAMVSIIAGHGAAPHFSGGYIGNFFSGFFIGIFGKVGAVLITFVLNIIGLILLGILSISAIATNINSRDIKLSVIFKNILKKIFLPKKRNEIPINYLGEAIDRKGKKLPWIIKKKIIYGADTGNEHGERIEPEKIQINNQEHKIKKVKLIEHRPAIDEPRELILRNSVEHETEEPSELIAEKIEETEIVPEYAETVDDELHSFEQDQDINFVDYHDEDESNKIEKNRIKSMTLEQDIKPAMIVEENESDDEFDSDDQDAEKQENDEAAEADDNEEKLLISRNREDKYNDEDEKPTTYIPKVFEEYKFSEEYYVPIGFLKLSDPIDSVSWKAEAKKNSELLVKTLDEFGIESRVINVHRGPVITLYEIQIAPGIKVNKIVGLSDDIAMALAAYKVRIVAPIPGKSAIGIEIPNSIREMVTSGDIMNTPEYEKQTGKLKVGLGKDILGRPITFDLKKQPHLLIAGATGAGKSICLNSLLCDLIYNYDPNYLRFILVDPKMVELQLYNGIPHLLMPVITECYLAPKALKWATNEMERRYRLLSLLSVRDIDTYNSKIKGYEDIYEKLPYIVIIIDELADLMMIAAKEVEGFITRIAQKARAVGIHMVLATQRPSVDVITGIIKANFPARIAFQVPQKIDSRTILDQNGAETLLGKGDMLYQSPQSSYPERIQGAFIAEDEIQKIVKHTRRYGKPKFVDVDDYTDDEEIPGEIDETEDELFIEAIKIIEETKKASASYLQRRLSIGYNRAARIIELMEDRGYVGPQQGSKPREVFI